MKRILIFIVFVFATGKIFAQPVIRTSVDKNSILIGEDLKYRVEANFPVNSYMISWPSLPDSFNHFEIVSRGRVDSVEKNGMLTCTQTLTLTSFDSGKTTIPSFPVGFSPLQTDTTLNIFTDSIPVNVTYSPLDSTKTFHDIKSIIDVKEEFDWLFWGLIGFLVLVLIGIAIFVIWYFKKHKKTKQVFYSKVSPVDEAMKSLDDLRKEGLLNKGEGKQFHIRLTDIFKRYISRKTGKNMMNKTSSEILLALNETLLTKEDTSLIANALRMSDAVKFAKYIPPVSESEYSLDDTKTVIGKFDKLIFEI